MRHYEDQTAANQYFSLVAQSEQVSSWVSASIWHSLVLFLYGSVISSLELLLYVPSVPDDAYLPANTSI